MNITSERAFDMLPYVVDIYDRLDIKEFAEREKEKTKDVPKEKLVETQKAIGENFIKYIIKNSSKVKEEFFCIVAIAQDTDIETVKQQNFLTTIKTFKEIFTDKDLMSFFKSAMP